MGRGYHSFMHMAESGLRGRRYNRSLNLRSATYRPDRATFGTAKSTGGQVFDGIVKSI